MGSQQQCGQRMNISRQYGKHQLIRASHLNFIVREFYSKLAVIGLEQPLQAPSLERAFSHPPYSTLALIEPPSAARMIVIDIILVRV